ncbi:MAG TPA: hypothetical protein VGK59_11615 [Ohtaekwangia sp.]
MRKYISVFLFLVSFCSFSQVRVMSVVSGRTPTQTVDSVETPYPFFANSVDTDSIRTEWIDIGADNYVLESDDNFNFSSPTTEYSGTNLSYTLTGLGANVKRYFRLHAETDGLANSPYVYDSATTFPFVPVAYYDFNGLTYGDNKFGDYNGSTFDTVYSVINYSGPDLRPVSSKGTISPTGGDVNYTAYNQFNNVATHSPSTAFVFGDFEINMRMMFRSTPNNSTIITNSSDALQRIRFVSLSQIQFARTTGVTVTLDNTLELGKVYWITFKRVGTTFTVIVRDVLGATQSKSGTCVSTSITFDRFFFTTPLFTTGKLIVMDRELTSAERLAAQDILKRPVHTPEASDTTIEPNGLTWNAASTYLVDATLSPTTTTSFVRDRFFGWGKYSFALVNKRFESPYYGADQLYAFDEVNNLISDPIDLGYYSTTNDTHNTGGICVSWNNCLVHFIQNHHYSDQVNNSLVVEIFGKDMNLVGRKTIPLGKGIVTNTGKHLQYHQAAIVNGKIYLIAQEFTGSANNSARRAVMLISDCEWTYFQKYQIYEIDDAQDDFIYPHLVYAEDRLILILDYDIYPETQQKAAYIAWCEPSISETTWKSVDGSFSKNIATSGPITDTEAMADLVLGTALVVPPTDTTNVKPSHGLYNPATEIMDIVRADGNDGFIYCAVDFDAGTMTEENIPPVIDGHNILIENPGSGAENQPFIYREGSDIYLVCHEQNSGDTKIIRCIRTGSSSWDYYDQISTDNTLEHVRMMPTKNWYYTQTRSIFATRVSADGNSGSLFRYNVSTP